MAKTVLKKVQKAKAAKEHGKRNDTIEKTDDKIDLQEASDSSLSDEQLSSDEEEEIEGLETPAPGSKPTANLGGHTVEFEAPEKKVSQANVKKRGVIYIGRLPQHFQEKEAKKYFKQFGEITRIRLSRNKTTGRMRHYGFIEFKHEDVAKIAAETMNNYLIFGHMLKVHVVDNPREDLFPAKLKGKFTEFDWRQRAYDAHHQKQPLSVWEKKQEEFEEQKKAKFDELKELGFNYALEA